MPWKETDKMEQKELFIKAMLANEKPFKHLCADFGISEKTGHKWKNCFYEQGKAGLCEQSRARLTQDMIDGDTAAELIRIKNAHLAWGPKKIREIYAKAYPQKDVPSLSSVKRILDKAGLVKPRKIRPPVSSDCPRLQQLIQHGGKLVTQCLINSRIALHHHILADQTACDVVLLGQPGELDEGFDLLVFLRGYPEGNSLVAPAVVVVSVFQ